MPSILARKPWTKCCRACSPSVTISIPASSCSFIASMVASRLARLSAAPSDFHGAHSTLGSASHSGFGSEPAIVVGNSMGVCPRLVDLGVYLPCLAGRVQRAVIARSPCDEAIQSLLDASGLLRYARNDGGTDDRPALRADAERLEDIDHAGGTRAALHGDPGEHPRRRAVQAGIS